MDNRLARDASALADPSDPSTSAAPAQRCGTVALVGQANVGKSTLINALIGKKVAIVTPKPKTTQLYIRGIFTQKQSQIILLDTPGMVKPSGTMEKASLHDVWREVDKSDLVLVVMDASARQSPHEINMLQRLQDGAQKVFLVLNKVDKITNKHDLLKRAHTVNSQLAFQQTFMISADHRDGLEELKTAMAKTMPVKPWVYTAKQYADVPVKLWAAEITREQLFFHLRQELPYRVHVVTSKFTRFRNKSWHFKQTIFVERESQKAIVLGRGGKFIKQIATHARKNMEKTFSHRVHLVVEVACNSQKLATEMEQLRK